MKFVEIAHEVIIPIIIFPIIAGSYLHERYRGSFNHSKSDAAIGFFREARNSWVTKNHLTGQASANTTRDYLRVIIFLAGNSILLATVFAGFAAQIATQPYSNGRQLMIIKLGVCVIHFMILFFCFLMSVRYATHFHFMMNVQEMNGKPLDLDIIRAVFNRGHRFYSAGLRLYYFCIPLFAWTFSAWALLAVSPLYMYIVRGLESLDWMQTELQTAGLIVDEGDGEVVEIGQSRGVMKLV